MSESYHRSSVFFYRDGDMPVKFADVNINLYPHEKKSYRQIATSLKGKIQILKEIPKPFSVVNLLSVMKESKRQAPKFTAVLKVNTGTSAPKFTLPNAFHQWISLDSMLKAHNVILIFYRGGWCAFCYLQLRVYQDYLAEFKQAGAVLVAVSSQMPDPSLSTKEKQDLTFEVLSDTGNHTARQYTAIMAYDEASKKALKGIGIDLNDYHVHGSGNGAVPVPAVFIIHQQGRVIFAGSKGGDHTLSVEPQDILAALRQNG